MVLVITQLFLFFFPLVEEEKQSILVPQSQPSSPPRQSLQMRGFTTSLVGWNAKPLHFVESFPSVSLFSLISLTLSEPFTLFSR